MEESQLHLQLEYQQFQQIEQIQNHMQDQNQGQGQGQGQTLVQGAPVRISRGKRGPYDAHTINEKIQHVVAFEDLRKQSPSSERALFEYYTSSSGVSRSTLQKWINEKDKMINFVNLDSRNGEKIRLPKSDGGLGSDEDEGLELLLALRFGSTKDLIGL